MQKDKLYNSTQKIAKIQQKNHLLAINFSNHAILMG